LKNSKVVSFLSPFKVGQAGNLWTLRHTLATISISIRVFLLVIYFIDITSTIGVELYEPFLRLAVHVARMGKTIIYRIFELNIEGKRQIGIHRCRGEYNIKRQREGIEWKRIE